MTNCNTADIMSFFLQNNPPVVYDDEQIDKVINLFTKTVCKVMEDNKLESSETVNKWGNEERWKRLLENKDMRKIWKAIGWNGEINIANDSVPSDSEFKAHFETFLDPGKDNEPIDVSDAPYIPILDDPVSESELIAAASSFKEGKSFIGVTPKILAYLPAVWLTFITIVINIVFLSNTFLYPLKWCYSKLIVLFKKGARLDCNNYRGISI